MASKDFRNVSSVAPVNYLFFCVSFCYGPLSVNSETLREINGEKYRPSTVYQFIFVQLQ